MKYAVATMVFIFSLSCLAATVKVTSFAYINQQSRLAELCGQVEGASTDVSFVKAVIDPRTKNPGSYNTVATKDGHFCLTVVTYSGLAELSLFGQSAATPATIQ